MKEGQPCLAFMEGPQGVGKSLAAEHVSSLGFKLTRGIPTGIKLTTNTNYQNWQESLKILEQIVEDKVPYVSDRSFWSLVVYNMRKNPKDANILYNLGSKMFYKRINGTKYNIILLSASPEDCMDRADSNSPVAIKSLKEAEKEAAAYQEILQRLKADGFNVTTLKNEGISQEEFLKQIEKLFV